MKIDGGNAVQLLILITGITLVPALLFTVTGFTRILIVLGFIRNGLGTPTAPPNQVLVGIALFLTIFVMAPTFNAIKKDAIDPLNSHKITQAEADLIASMAGSEEPQPLPDPFADASVDDLPLGGLPEPGVVQPDIG